MFVWLSQCKFSLIIVRQKVFLHKLNEYLWNRLYVIFDLSQWFRGSLMSAGDFFIRLKTQPLQIYIRASRDRP